MHYLAVVIIPADTENIPETVAEILEPHKEWQTDPDTYGGWWDWYEIGGRWDEHIPGNVVPVRDLSETAFYRIVLPDGRSERREEYNPEWRDGDDWDTYFLPNSAFTEMVGRDLVAYRDHLAVAVDYHC